MTQDEKQDDASDVITIKREFLDTEYCNQTPLDHSKSDQQIYF